MTGRWFSSPSLLVAIALILSAQCALAQNFVQTADRMMGQRQQPTQVFGIMGEVGRPGVYEMRERSVTLAKLVEYAGGLTKNAQGRVRLIRAGRAGQQTWYTPNSRYELFPGDLVIVDSASNAGFATNEPGPEFVQIGFVNLLSYPVVVKLRRELATAAGIVSYLGQHAQTAQQVRIISSTRFSGRSNQSGHLLPSGTVMIFDPRTIDYSRIPALPSPFTAEALGAERRNGLQAPNPIASGRNTVPQPRPFTYKMRGIDPPVVPGRVHIAKPFKDAVEVHTPPIDDEPKDSVTGAINIFKSFDDEADKSDSEEELPIPSNIGSTDAEETETVANMDQDLTMLPEPVLEESPESKIAEADTTSKDKTSKTAATDSISTETEAELSTESTQAAATVASKRSAPVRWTRAIPDGMGFFNWPAFSIGIVVVAAILIASIVLWPMVKPEPPRPEREPTAREHLESIINKQMAVVEEALPLPQLQEFYGTPSSPRQYRLDAQQRHGVPKPHFRPDITSKEPVLAGQFASHVPTIDNELSSSVTVAADATASHHEKEKSAIPAPHMDVIERALRTVRGEQRG